MDGRDRAIDNIFIERLWGTVKQDYVYLHPNIIGTLLFDGVVNFASESWTTFTSIIKGWSWQDRYF